MDAELKTKWVAALRSGEYQQMRHSLFADGRYCCLGVLGCVANGVEGEVGAYGMREAMTNGYDWFRKAFPNLDPQTVTDMNDGGKSFPEIADYIEANL